MIKREGLVGYAINRARFTGAALSQMLEAARLANIANGTAEWKINLGIVGEPVKTMEHIGPQKLRQIEGPLAHLLPDQFESSEPRTIDTQAIYIRQGEI